MMNFFRIEACELIGFVMKKMGQEFKLIMLSFFGVP